MRWGGGAGRGGCFLKHFWKHAVHECIDVFCGAWLHFQRARVGSVFIAAVCKIQASKRCVESSPLVLKDRRSCFSQGERFAVQLPLDHMLTLQK